MKEEKKRVSHRQIQSSSFAAAAAQAPRVSSSKGAQHSQREEALRSPHGGWGRGRGLPSPYRVGELPAGAPSPGSRCCCFTPAVASGGKGRERKGMKKRR
jgi:hypothetical protein